MRIRIGMLAIIMELGLLSCSGVVMAQYPAQRFGKVTASQVETTTLTLRSGSAAGRILASDVSGNGLWRSLAEIGVPSAPGGNPS
jgi:hypothetical protein